MKYRKNVFHIILSFIILGMFSGCAAKKELVALQSTYDELKQELSMTNFENENLEKQVNSLNGELEAMNDQVATRNEEVEKLEKQLQAAQSSLEQISQQEAECPEDMVKGIVFKVQIGAFENRDLSADLDSSVNFEEEGKGDLSKYVIGQFRDYYKADQLQNQLREMGVKDAWIVPYKDGNRVPLEEVVNTVIN